MKSIPKCAHHATLIAAAAVLLTTPVNAQQSAGTLPQVKPREPQHDTLAPQPGVVRPAVASTQERAGRAPSDAVVLFDGRDISKFVGAGGKAAAWTVRDGYFEVKPGEGAVTTKESFGDMQMHIEWQSPAPPQGTGQNRGNSGVFLMGFYELQILDSYGSTTYPDGQAAALYGQYPPAVNASLPPGQWQTYDIIFRRPRFNADGTLATPAFLTLFHNGVLVHDHTPVAGPVGHHARPPYRQHADRLPFSLQDHDHPVRFRNVWVRDLEK